MEGIFFNRGKIYTFSCGGMGPNIGPDNAMKKTLHCV